MSDRYDPLLRRTTELTLDYLNGLESERFPSSGCSCSASTVYFPIAYAAIRPVIPVMAITAWTKQVSPSSSSPPSYHGGM